MNRRRFALLSGVTFGSLAVLILLITTLLASTQPMPAAMAAEGVVPEAVVPEAVVPEAVVPEAVVETAQATGPHATQAISVTFPPGSQPMYVGEGMSVHPEPAIPGQPTELCVEVINLDLGQPHTVTVEFGVAPLGIGVPFAPVGQLELPVPPDGAAGGCVVWVPPDPGHWSIEVSLAQAGVVQPLRRQRNLDIWEPLVPGQETVRQFPVGPFPDNTTISFTTKNVAAGWSAMVEPISLTLAPDQPGQVNLTVKPPANEPLGSRAVVVDVEGYVNGQLIGGFRKLDTPPVPLHRLHDPVFAESEISVWPYPLLAGEPTELCVELFNLSDISQTVEVMFEWAEFGIGLPFHPIGPPALAEIEPHSHQVVCTWWVAPMEDQVGIQVKMDIPGATPYHTQFSQRILDVNEPLQPGVGHVTQIRVGNFFNELHNPNPVAADIWLEADIHLPGWQVEFPDPVPLHLSHDNEGVVTMIVTPTADLPGDGAPVADIRAFVDGGAGPRLIGGFRKLFRPPVPLHRFPDPIYAEREISIEPYPPRAGEPTELCVELRNATALPQDVEVQFLWSEFGIGLPYIPINGLRDVHLPPHSIVRECIHWIPPLSGQVGIMVELFMAGHTPQWSQRNLDVNEPLQPNTAHSRVFPVVNPFDHPVTITLGLIPHFPNWGLTLTPDVLTNVMPGLAGAQPFTLTVTPPADLPGDGDPIVDVEAFGDGEFIGGFRKLFRPPVPLHRFPDPIYAEREISVEPYPPRAGEPTEVCVELRNELSLPQDVAVQFLWSEFGIGMPYIPINGLRDVHLPPHSIVRECIHWIPPLSGQVGIMVELFMAGHAPQWSQRNIDADEPLEPNTAHDRVFRAVNPFNYPVTITLGLIPHFPNWGLSLTPDVLTNVMPGLAGARLFTLTVTPPADLPGDGDPIVDVEAYVEGEFIGGFRKIFRPPVPLHRPMDPIYAESEISVHPYPPRAREPTELGVEIRNPTDANQTITVTFSYANFGIGLPFTPIDHPFTVTVPAGGMIRPTIIWLPPDEGLWCIQVDIELPGYDESFYSQRNMDVGEPLEPLIPHSRLFLVGNPYNHPVTITLGLVPHFPNWGLELSADVLTNVLPGPGGARDVMLTVTPPADLPGDGDPIVDVEAFVDGVLIGGFRKIFRPPVPLHRPRDPVYAESEIGIDPYPIIPGQPVELSVEVFNPTDQDRVVTVTFSVAQFGIGLPFRTDDIVPNPIRVFVPAHGAARGHVIWSPLDWHGKFCVQVELEMEGHEPVWSRRNIDVGEPLEPGQAHSLQFPVGSWPYTRPVTVSLGLVDHRDGWSISLSPDVLTNVHPNIAQPVTLTVVPPLDVVLGVGEPIVDVEAFVDGELIGGFRKMDIPPIPLHKPHEKGYAESEISIVPYPPVQGADTRVSTVVQNSGSETVTVGLEFGWAKFGMGIPFTNTGMAAYTRTVTLSPAMSATASVPWIPSLSGPQCVIILLDAEGYEQQVSQRNVNVEERPPCGQTKVFTFTVYNDANFTQTVDIGLMTFDVPAAWTVTTVPSDTLDLGPNSEGVVTVTVQIPCPSTVGAMWATREMVSLQAMAGSVPTVDVEGYIKGGLVGGVELRFPEPARYEQYLPIIFGQ